MLGKIATVFASVVGVTVLLSGCSIFNPGPPRDENGRVTEATKISARDLKDGDCFTFNSADGSIVDDVTVMPCAEKHAYLVIAQGTLTQAEISSSSSLQDAVSAACNEPFDRFKDTVKGDTRPEQQFMVFPETDQENSDQKYSCISTDPDQAANDTGSVETPAPTPAPTP